MDTPPDRLSVNPKSRFHNEELLTRGIGIRFNGKERNNVEEYSVSEGWIRVPQGRAVDRKGNPITLKLNGTVEPYFKDVAQPEG
jgi:hypothetical protein